MTHVHFFRLQVEGPDCNECQYSAIVGIATCGCGEVLGPTAIERRLNATEKLSADAAKQAAMNVIDLPGIERAEQSESLRAYAAAREGKDD